MKEEENKCKLCTKEENIKKYVKSKKIKYMKKIHRKLIPKKQLMVMVMDQHI